MRITKYLIIDATKHFIYVIVVYSYGDTSWVSLWKLWIYGCRQETSDCEQDTYAQLGTFTSLKTMFGISLYCFLFK